MKTRSAADKQPTGRKWNVITRRLLPLDSAKLCAEARGRTGLRDFGDPEIESRLSVLTQSLESEANLHPLGWFLARMHLRSLLETRLRLNDAWNKSDAVVDGRSVHRPIFISGMPRSGSTFLHELFAQDGENRVPLVWEVMFPCLKAAPGEREINQRIRKTSACLWWFRQIAPEADAVHPLRATTPQECGAMHSYTLLSREFETIFHIPSYETYLKNIGLDAAYAWQKRFLQHLLTQGSAKQCVLKAPDHVFSLDALFTAFPDAVIIQTHRDPFAVLKSSSHLVEVLRGTFARSEPRDQLARREAGMLADGLDRITRFRDTHPELAERFIDIHYESLVANPLAAVRWLYAQLDLPLIDATAARISSLASARSRYARQTHRPRANATLDEFAVDRRVEARRFESYCARFGIQQA